MDTMPMYSGSLSKKFWKRINALPDKKVREVVYLMGCALQDIEARVIQALAEAESN